MNIVRETVTSAQNKYVSLARSLAAKKAREKEKRFRFDGVKLMCEAVKQGVNIELALVAESELSSVVQKAEKLYGIKDNELNFPVIRVADHLFERLSEEQAPEGVICIAEYMSELHSDICEGDVERMDRGERILLLESVRDPANVGAIVRVAAAFGVDRLIISSDCADIYNSKTLRASMGTLFSTRVDRADDLTAVVGELCASGRRVFAAALNRSAHVLGELEIVDGDCVIIGNEGHGLSNEIIEACTGSVFIPMSAQVESLNAATAAAVLVWEFFGSANGRRAL